MTPQSQGVCVDIIVSHGSPVHPQPEAPMNLAGSAGVSGCCDRLRADGATHPVRANS